jgi:enoyl-CoA hydratase/carnithine racemase
MTGPSVLVESRGPVLRVQLHRAEKRNALTLEMLDALHAALDRVEAEQLSVLLLSGAEGVFCAGADIATYVDAIDDLDALAAFGARAKSLTHRLSRSPAIIVAAVDGVAMGGGFELVLSADLVVATDRARFGLPEIRLGLIPGWEGTQRLARHLGPHRAKEAILLARVLSAAQLADAGIVTRIVAPEELGAAADELVDALSAQAPLALAAAKAAVTASYELDPATPGSDLETRSLLALFASEDGREGVRAFVGKRAPVFRGR